MLKVLALSASLLATPAIATTPREMCQEVGDDAAILMAYRQNDGELSKALKQINTSKYFRTGSENLLYAMVELSWRIPKQPTALLRQQVYQGAGRVVYDDCMKEIGK